MPHSSVRSKCDDDAAFVRIHCTDAVSYTHLDVYKRQDYEGAWGLADSDGKFLTDPVYDEIGYFTGSYAVVTQNGKRGIINDRGKVVVKP